MRNPWGIGAVLCTLVVPAVALAQPAPPPFDKAIDVQTFEYAIGPKTFFTVADADVADVKQLAVDAVFTYLTKPFKIFNTTPDGEMITGDRVTVVDSVAAMQITGAYGIKDKIHIGAKLPVIFSLSGDGLDPA